MKVRFSKVAKIAWLNRKGAAAHLLFAKVSRFSLGTSLVLLVSSLGTSKDKSEHLPNINDEITCRVPARLSTEIFLYAKAQQLAVLWPNQFANQEYRSLNLYSFEEMAVNIMKRLKQGNGAAKVGGKLQCEHETILSFFLVFHL